MWEVKNRNNKGWWQGFKTSLYPLFVGEDEGKESLLCIIHRKVCQNDLHGGEFSFSQEYAEGQDGLGVQEQDRGVLCDRSGSETSLPGVRGHLSKSPAVWLWQVTLAYLGLICEVELMKIRYISISESCVGSGPSPLKSQ